MPYYWDFPSNVSANYNTLKLVAANLDALVKKDSPGFYAKLVTQVDDALSVKSLTYSIEIYCNNNSFSVTRTFTAGTAMTNAVINTNTGTFITSDLASNLANLLSFING